MIILTINKIDNVFIISAAVSTDLEFHFCGAQFNYFVSYANDSTKYGLDQIRDKSSWCFINYIILLPNVVFNVGNCLTSPRSMCNICKDYCGHLVGNSSASAVASTR